MNKEKNFVKKNKNRYFVRANALIIQIIDYKEELTRVRSELHNNYAIL